ncbi:hypothetical protein V9K67_21850 [Paraflavisolibacter sp. H34]|uniref:hypothetical protein n=1 Tax=Huijunlia imazamoxiresistens TaxID=3127457 RepID=UPI0030194F8C
MKFAIIGLSFLILFSCSPKPYKVVQSAKNEYNASSNGTLIYLQRKINPLKLIFKRLDRKIDEENFVFIFSWVNHLPIAGTNDFRALFVDNGRNKKRFFYNKIEAPKTVYMVTDNSNFRDLDFILGKVLEGKVEDLASLPPKFSSAEVGEQFYVFDIKNGKAKVYIIKNFFLD